MASVLEVNEVNQAFRAGFWLKRVEVLHQVSLRVPERSVFGFLGANGAGKTTLIHLIVGLRRPISGQVRVAGLDASAPQARARVGYLPERPYFHEHLTGEGLLHYFGALSGMTRAKVMGRIPSVLRSVGMEDARKIELRRYSKGMLQRIGIAQAILHDPPFLVLDEPMSGLDPLGRKEIRELIVRLAAEGRTIFFSSHVISDVEAICDQVGVIRKGKMLGCGPIGTFLSDGPLQTEVAFSGVAPDRLAHQSKFISVREISNGYRGVVGSQGDVNAILLDVIDQKGKVLWVTPQRPSLEELFAR